MVCDAAELQIREEAEDPDSVQSFAPGAQCSCGAKDPTGCRWLTSFRLVKESSDWHPSWRGMKIDCGGFEVPAVQLLVQPGRVIRIIEGGVSHEPPDPNWTPPGKEWRRFQTDQGRGRSNPLEQSSSTHHTAAAGPGKANNTRKGTK